MNYDNSEKLGSDLTATEKFVIHSMTKKIQDDWDIGRWRKQILPRVVQ